MKKKLFAIIFSALMMIGIGLVETQQAAAGQPLMRRALRRLRRARRARLIKHKRALLRRAAWNKGGHRVRAIHFIGRALRALRKGRRVRAQRLITRAIVHVRRGIRAGRR